ncbi:MAG: ATP-binding cassette domain-containing protein [Desulfobulbaceae bacterium]|nr:ATP-binding cassette domain-containing protein [Desulfobulbaceae bacterium]
MGEQSVGDTSVCFSGVSFSYQTDSEQVDVLNNLTFSIPKHQVCGLVGPSGCGKSTVLKIIADLIPKNQRTHMAGTVRVFGERLENLRNGGYISYVPQNPSLFPWWTVIDNVMLPYRIAGNISAVGFSQAEELLRKVGLWEFRNSKATELSVGMQRRASIVRALLYSSDLMLLDEPLASLDEMTREEIGIVLAGIQSEFKTTTIMVSHDLSETVLFCDRVLVLSPRPSRLVVDIPINLSRPRCFEHRNTDTFFLALRDIRRALASAAKRKGAETTTGVQ